MPNPYGVCTRESTILGPVTSLKILYDAMPSTSGCEKCAEVNGEENKDWCCRRQSPSMYYVEFLQAWMEVQNKWSKKKKTDLIVRAIRNYLTSSLSKGCIFYDGGCTIYKQRPFICRLYGIIPKESWDKRWEYLKERQGEHFDAKPQCPLVVADKEVKPEDEDKWFKHTQKCEERIGMPKDLMQLHDQPGGPYRTFHDHLLIELFPAQFLEMLTKVRLTKPSKEDIEETIKVLKDSLEKSTIIT